MENVITSLTTSLSSTNLWGVVGDAVPLIAISVLFGLGFGLVRKVLNKTRNRKGGM